MFKRIIAIVLIITMITMFTFQSMAFAEPVTLTAGALFIVGSMLVAYGISTYDGKSFEDCCIAAYQNAESNVKNIINWFDETFSGNPAGQEIIIEPEMAQPINDWVQSIVPTPESTIIKTNTPFQELASLTGITYQNLEVSIVQPWTTNKYTYYVNPQLNMSYKLNSDFTFDIEWLFKDGLSLKSVHNSITAYSQNLNVYICKPVLLPTKTMYFPFYVQTNASVWTVSWGGNNAIRIQPGNHVLSLYDGRVRYHNGTNYVYLTSSNESYTSLANWLGTVISTNSEISVQVDDNSYNRAKTLFQDTTISKVISIPQTFEELITANPSDVLKETDVENPPATGFFDTLINTAKNILDYVKTIPTLISNVISYVASIPQSIAIELDKLFNPNSPHLPPQDPIIPLMIENKLPFINQIKDSIRNLDVSGHKLEFRANILGQERVVISSDWFEPYRLYIRGGLSALFWVMTALSCFRLVSSVFGMGINSAAGIGYVQSGGVTGLRRGNR